MKNVLVTGAGGYVGSIMVETLLNRGDTVTGLDRFFFGVTALDRNIMTHPHFKLLQDDIRWVKPAIFKGVQVVVDLAALSNDPSGAIDPRLTEQINHEGRVRMAKLAKENGVERYILASSCSVYGHGNNEILTEDSPLRPVSEYAKATAAAEADILPLADQNYAPTVLRQATLFGYSPRMRFDLVLNLMTLHATQKGRIFVMGGGKQWRPLIHVRDTVEAFVQIIEAPRDRVAGQIFNAGSTEQNYQVLSLAYLVKECLPFHVEIEVAPDDPDRRNYRVAFDKIRRELSFNPRFTPEFGVQEIYQKLKQGILEASEKTVTVKWYKYLIDADSILNSVKIDGKLF